MLRPLLRRAATAIATVLAAATLHAQVPFQSPQQPLPFRPDPLHQRGENVTISLLTMGNADDVASMFGHSAILVRDDVSGRDSVFGWGEYDLRAPHFIWHFVQGLLLYRMDGQPLINLLFYYQHYNRSVVSQELNLTAAQKDTLLRLIQINTEPQNVTYRYDYFVDNCATRPRDLLDRALGGQLRLGADSLTSRTYRWHTLRLMQSNIPLTLGVDIGLGRPADRPITRWEEMFLPKELHDWVATRQVRDSTGAMRPLVRSERVLFQAQREPEPSSPPPLGRWLWPIGIVIGLLFVLAGARTEQAAVRVAAALGAALWATVCGVLGVVLAFLWLGTDHRFAHYNENVLLFNPLWLPLVVLLPMFMLRGRPSRATTWLTYAVAALAVLALLMHAGVSRQSNLPIIGLALPVTLGVCYALVRCESVVSGVDRARILRAEPANTAERVR